MKERRSGRCVEAHMWVRRGGGLERGEKEREKRVRERESESVRASGRVGGVLKFKLREPEG
eukprot:736414-Amorphochlora_amoeboformis.AAC.2